MLALVIHQPFASQIASGAKTREYRSWPTRHRGPLLVCAAASPDVPGLPCGRAVAVVDVVDCRRLASGMYSWHLARPRVIESFPVKGRQGLFHVDPPRGIRCE